uniref:Uncharacterized protein n=1 Tax=Yushu Chuvi tick virus 1 TaxID=2972089 RepID=A0A9E8A9I1_9VIRU|nr:MAG: hypothetical protein [Yushu Chuvi tick virus 1]WAS28125.1 MAG: hypothetical protein [Chuviridae sp.]
MFPSGRSQLYSEDDAPIYAGPSDTDPPSVVAPPPLMMNTSLLAAKLDSVEKEVRAQSARITALEAKVVETLHTVQQIHQLLKTLVVVSKASDASGFKATERSPPKMPK